MWLRHPRGFEAVANMDGHFKGGDEGIHMGEVGFGDADRGLGVVLDGVMEVEMSLVDVVEGDLLDGIVLLIVE